MSIEGCSHVSSVHGGYCPECEETLRSSGKGTEDMLIIVLDTATQDETTEAALRRSGYAKREVWVKEVSFAEADHEGGIVRALGVGRYVAADAWGRGPE